MTLASIVHKYSPSLDNTYHSLNDNYHWHFSAVSVSCLIDVRFAHVSIEYFLHRRLHHRKEQNEYGSILTRNRRWKTCLLDVAPICVVGYEAADSPPDKRKSSWIHINMHFALLFHDNHHSFWGRGQRFIGSFFFLIVTSNDTLCISKIIAYTCVGSEGTWYMFPVTETDARNIGLNGITLQCCSD
jgi:hypothetical protein